MSGTPTITAQDLKKARRPDYIGMLMAQIAATGFPRRFMNREVKFHPDRRWRIDLGINAALRPERRVQWIAVECEGGLFIQGRHSRGFTAEKDMEKYAEAAILGWTVLRVSPRQIKNGQAKEWVRRLLNA